MLFHARVLKTLSGSVRLVVAGGVLVLIGQAEPLHSAMSSQGEPFRTVQLLPLLSQSAPASSQSGYPTCQPPGREEYLLLVVSPTAENQNQIRRSLPARATATVCNYQGNVVTRVSGFTSVDSADAWAKYLNELTGLSTFIARSPTQSKPAEAPPVASQAPSSASETQNSASRNPLTFSPRPLGGGYAVLVDFFSRPELAAQVQQALGKDIGLVSYRQRPYLLAVYTSDQGTANAALKTLTDRGFWAMMVDARRVTLLKQSVSVSRDRHLLGLGGTQQIDRLVSTH